MLLPIGVASRVSARMSVFLESIANDPDFEGPVTLGLARERLAQLIEAQGLETDCHEFGGEQSLFAEMEALAEEFGEEASALDFITVKASERLSEVIEAVLDQAEDADVAATLGRLREIIADGMVARLVGEGVVEDDEAQTLLAEVDGLIERYGKTTLVEDLLGFE